MALNQTIIVGVIGGSTSHRHSIVDSADARLSRDFPVAASTTDHEVALVIDVSEIKSIYINCNENITLETNATDAAGGDTLALIANQPYVWWEGSLYTNLLATDITTSYWTNGTTNVATVTLECVVDPTP